MHKRRATGGKKKAWRKKRKCVPLSFIHFNIMNVFIYFNLVLFLFFCCLEFPNAVAESEGCVCIRFLVVLIGMMVRIFSWLFMAFDGLKLKVFFFYSYVFFLCSGAYGRSRCSCSSGFSFCFVRGRGKERVIVLEFRLEV